MTATAAANVSTENASVVMDLPELIALQVSTIKRVAQMTSNLTFLSKSPVESNIFMVY
jgi:hypothetical protein